MDAVIGEAMVLDFTPSELREAFEKKFGQWKSAKEGE
jgi:predicted Zn-dependent peptidase